MLGKRLKILREERKLTIQDLADALNRKYNTKISKSMISRWENNKSDINLQFVRILTDYFGVSYEELVDDIKMPTNIITMGKMRNIPIIGEIACGDPILAEQNIDGYRTEVADRVPSGNLFFLKCKGTSMEPTISDGAYVLIKEQPEVEEGEIAAVLVDDQTEATLKRVHHQNGSIVLSGDNPTFPPIILNEKFPGRIIGKAVKVSFDL